MTDALDSYERSTTAQVAALSEFQVGRVLARDSEQSEASATHKHIIRAPESGNNDLGILVSHKFPDGLEGDATTKFMQLVCSDVGPDAVVPMDIKSFMAMAIYETITWTLNLTPQQMKTCQALVIVSPKEPDFVLLIPVHYLRQRKDVAQGRSTHFEFSSGRLLWTLHPLPAFPPSFTPFVLPFLGLGDAVTDMRDYMTGKAASWTNRYTKVAFVDVPRPSSFDLSVLEPDFRAFHKAFEEQVVLFKAFGIYSKRFQIRFCDIQPMLSDFKIIHLLTNEESHVEAKDMHCRFVPVRGTDTLLLQHSQSCLPSPDRAVFTWKAQWDYLWTHINSGSSSQKALFVPRDKIPKSWWNYPLSDEEEPVWLDWPADHPDRFDSFLVDETTDARLVKDVERILMTNPAKAQEQIGMDPVASETLTDTSGQFEDPAPRDHAEDLSSFRRGCGSAAHADLRGDTYQEWASEVLLELCRACGKGAVLDLGSMESVSRYWMAYYTWSQDDIKRYDQNKEPPCPVWRLHRGTPIVPIHFLKLAFYHGLEPWCVRSSDFSAKIIASHPSSLIVCDLFPSACARLPHRRFLLPSDRLPRVSYGTRFRLAEGLLDEYSVEENNIVDTILSILDGSQTTIGLCNKPVQSSDFVRFLHKVWQAGAAGFANESKKMEAARKKKIEAAKKKKMEAAKKKEMEAAKKKKTGPKHPQQL